MKKMRLPDLKAMGINRNSPLSKLSEFDQQTVAMCIWGQLNEAAKDILIDYMGHKGDSTVTILTMYNFLNAFVKKDKVVRYHFYFNQAMRNMRPWGQVTRPGFMLP